MNQEGKGSEEVNETIISKSIKKRYKKPKDKGKKGELEERTLVAKEDETIDIEKEMTPSDQEEKVEEDEERIEKKGEEKKKKKKKRKKKKDKEREETEEEEEGLEEEEIKYSNVMWVAIVMLFFGILMVVLGLWMANSTFAIIGAVLLLIGIPLFIFEYRKMDPAGKRSVKRSAVLLFRDVCIALLIVGIIMAAIIAYSQVWPPMVVIESDSMQHSETESYIGTIDTGDLVLVKNAPTKSDVTTYVEGRGNGHYTYGDYGDVIVFRRCGASPETTPIIHRAMVYLELNETTGNSFDIPALEDLEFNKDWFGLDANGNPVNSPYNLTGSIWLYNVGYENVSFTIFISSYIDTAVEYNATAFYLTAGDHNLGRGSVKPDPFPPCNGIVKQDWIVGVARGELPWFGLIKLTLNPGTTGCCDGWGDSLAPKNSWDSLLISLVLIITIPFILDFTIGFIRDRRRKKKKGEEKEEKSEEKESTDEKEMKKKKKKKKRRKKKSELE